LFDATSGGSAVAADGTVARLEDKSGNNLHFTQSTSANRPVRKTSVKNGLDVLRFDGTDDYLDSSVGFSSLFTSTKTTCFIVAKAATASTNSAFVYENEMLLSEDQDGHGFFVVKTDDTVGSFGYSVSNDPRWRLASDSYTPGDWIVLSTWHDGTTLSVAVNGGTEQSISLSTRSFLGVARMGANHYASSPAFFDGDVGEIITYNETLTAQARADVESWLMSKWAIT
jgi:hypothetical protein